MKSIVEEERVYTLSNRADQDDIIAGIVSMAPNATITFLLSEKPMQGEFGKIGFRTGRERTIDDFLYLDIPNDQEKILLYATTSDEDQSDN